MSTKYVLLPQQNYFGLLNKKSDETKQKVAMGDDLEEKGNFNFVKRQLTNVKNRRGKNLSTKNALYNQLLRSYLRLRKQLIQKPVKVEVTKSGPKLISKTKAEGDEAVKALVDEDGELELFERGSSMSPLEPEKEEEPIDYKSAYSKTPTQSSKTRTGQSSVSSYSSSQSIETPKQITPILTRRQLKQKEKDEEDLAKIEAIGNKIYKIVKKNPGAFGISEKDEIINPRTGKAIVDSDFKKSLLRLLRPTIKNAPSPAGMKTLRAALNKDEEIARLLNPQIGKGAIAAFGLQHFKPTKWGKMGKVTGK